MIIRVWFVENIVVEKFLKPNLYIASCLQADRASRIGFLRLCACENWIPGLFDVRRFPVSRFFLIILISTGPRMALNISIIDFYLMIKNDEWLIPRVDGCIIVIMRVFTRMIYPEIRGSRLTVMRNVYFVTGPAAVIYSGRFVHESSRRRRRDSPR